jgi:hypothetical protein
MSHGTHGTAAPQGAGPPSTMDFLEFSRCRGMRCRGRNRRPPTAPLTLIERFWRKEGHPAYPVFWDFAFVIAGPTEAEVFIGSSSD